MIMHWTDDDNGYHTCWTDEFCTDRISYHLKGINTFDEDCPFCEAMQPKEQTMGDGDHFNGDSKPLPGTAGEAQHKTVKNAWQINVDKWFGLRTPTQVESAQLNILRSKYLRMAYTILDNCPSNPDRTHAIRQLKESMQTAISSIVCSDTWDDLPGPKGE